MVGTSERDRVRSNANPGPRQRTVGRPAFRHARVRGLARTPNRGPTSLLSALCRGLGQPASTTAAAGKEGPGSSATGWPQNNLHPPPAGEGVELAETRLKRYLSR